MKRWASAAPAVSGPVLVEYAPDVLAGGSNPHPRGGPAFAAGPGAAAASFTSWQEALSTMGLPPRLPRLRPGLSASPIRFTSAA